MQHVVGIAHATLYGIRVGQVAADYGQPAFLGKLRYLTVCVGMAFARRAYQHAQFYLVRMLQHLQHSLEAHRACRSRQKYLFPGHWFLIN